MSLRASNGYLLGVLTITSTMNWADRQVVPILFPGIRAELGLSDTELGIIGGLFLGKQIGVLAAVYFAKLAGLAVLPAGASWRQIYGVAALCGIGFTMSLFIGLLAFTDPAKEAVLKLAVLAGSLLSALAGALILSTAPPAKSKRAR